MIKCICGDTVMRVKNNIIYIIVLCITVLSMIYFFLLSPYELWNPIVKQVDDDKLLVLRMAWIFIFLINTVFAFITRPNNRVFFVTYLILTLLSLIKLISLFFV